MEASKRGLAARLGIVLLNLLSPGLGLLRLGNWRVGLATFAASLTGLLFFDFGPPAPFSILVLALFVGLAAIVISAWYSWRLSRAFIAPRPWYARWYVIVAAACLAVALNFVLTGSDRLRYRAFYLPSEAMAPTLQKWDRLIAYMRPLGPLRRGDLVLIRTHAGSIYVKRVAAIGGDHFAMKNGLVLLNGLEVAQRLVGVEQLKNEFGSERVRRLSERFPGEQSPHQIYDAGPTPEDDTAELIVPAGAVVLLGDNRDLSADSRAPVYQGGLGGPVATTDVVGHPFYQSWGSSRPLGAKLMQ